MIHPIDVAQGHRHRLGGHDHAAVGVAVGGTAVFDGVDVAVAVAVGVAVGGTGVSVGVGDTAGVGDCPGVSVALCVAEGAGETVELCPGVISAKGCGSSVICSVFEGL